MEQLIEDLRQAKAKLDAAKQANDDAHRFADECQRKQAEASRLLQQAQTAFFEAL